MSDLTNVPQGNVKRKGSGLGRIGHTEQVVRVSAANKYDSKFLRASWYTTQKQKSPFSHLESVHFSQESENEST